MSPRWLYLALAVGAALGALLTSRQSAPVAVSEPPVSGVVLVPFELNGKDMGVCRVRVTDGVVELVDCEAER